MLKEPFSGSRRLLRALLSLIGIAALLGLTFLGSLHAHHDLKFHNDCSICLWQASFFSLIHRGIPLTCVAAIAFLALFQLRFSPFTQVVRLVPIRAPPDLLA